MVRGCSLFPAEFPQMIDLVRSHNWLTMFNTQFKELPIFKKNYPEFNLQKL